MTERPIQPLSPLFILYRGTPTSLPLLYFANFLSKITCILAAPWRHHIHSCPYLLCQDESITSEKATKSTKYFISDGPSGAVLAAAVVGLGGPQLQVVAGHLQNFPK